MLTTIKNLSTNQASPAGGGNEYYFPWSYKGVTYFANAEVDSTGAVTYHDGTLSGNQYTNAHTDTGKLRQRHERRRRGRRAGGERGLAAGRRHARSGRVRRPRCWSARAQTGGLIETADSGGPKYDYVMGQHCG